MSKRKMRTYIFASGAFAVALLFLALIYFRFVHENDGIEKIPVYAYNPVSNALEAEERAYPVGSETEQVQAMLGHILPDGVSMPDSSMAEGDTLVVSFSSNYRNLSPLEEAILRTSCVWTLTELPFVRQVQVLVDNEELLDSRGEALGPITRQAANIDPIISPERTAMRVLTLYFPSDQTDGLYAEERTLNVTVDTFDRFIVHILIEGTNMEGCVSAIPGETKVRDVKTEDGICHVDLSSHFMSRFNGSPALARLVVYSIVNTLIENSGNIKKVQFLIESERVAQYNGVLDFDRQFEKNDDIIIRTGYEHLTDNDGGEAE